MSPQTTGPENALRTLVTLGNESATGVLHVRNGGRTTYVYLRSGAPVFAEGGSREDRIGQLLLKQGLLTNDGYRQVIEAMTKSLVDSEEARFGEVAVQLGLLSHHQIHSMLADQVRFKITHCLAADDCSVRFLSSSAEEIAQMPQYPVAIASLVYAVVRQVFGSDRWFAILAPAWQRYSVLRKSVEEVATSFGFGGAEHRILAQIDGTQTTQRLLESGGADAARVAHVLVSLELTSELRFRDAPKRERSMSQATMVAVQVAAVQAPAVQQVAVQQGPAKPAPAPQAPKLQAQFQTVTEPKPTPAIPATRPIDQAPIALAQAQAAQAPATQRAFRPQRATAPEMRAVTIEQKPNADPEEIRREAERLFRSGRDRLRAGQSKPAEAELKKAAALDPSSNEYGLYAVFATWLNARGAEEQASRRAALHDTALRVIEKNRDVAFAHYVLARIALAEGDREVAIRRFKYALKLDPKDADTERYLRVLGNRDGKK